MLQQISERVMQTPSANAIARRSFLKGAAASAGALLIPLAAIARSDAANAAETHEITDWVRLGSDGGTVIGLSQCEVGQGVYTGLPQILADEMDADWRTVSVEFVTGRDAYRTAAANEPLQQFVGASMSTTQFYTRLRVAGAQAREALLHAGAARLGVRFTQCETREGHVVHPNDRPLHCVWYACRRGRASSSQSQPAPQILGGSFGRKYVPDFVLHAAIASQAAGKPVKVIRSREDDIRHGYYRPCASARFRAVLGSDGLPEAMHARIVGQSLYGVIKQKVMAAAGGWDETMLDSIYDLIYRVPNLTVDNIDTKQPIPVSFMRSVGSTASVFFLESFIDELADRAKIDPYQYRRKLLAHDARAVAVLDLAAMTAGWQKPPLTDIHRGIAFNLYTGRGGAFDTYVAAVAEVEITKGRIAVKRVV
jgi:CO/xanthine dehydrogenase Mo-binding subunit